MQPQQVDLIVSRHQGAIEWLRSNLFPAERPAYHQGDRLEWVTMEEEPSVYRVVPIRSEVAVTEIVGAHVVGNLPLHLAALFSSVTAIEFVGTPPRGAEYGVPEMCRAGARLNRYVVLHKEDQATCRTVFQTAIDAGVPFSNTPDGGVSEVERVAKKFQCPSRLAYFCREV